MKKDPRTGLILFPSFFEAFDTFDLSYEEIGRLVMALKSSILDGDDKVKKQLIGKDKGIYQLLEPVCLASNKRYNKSIQAGVKSGLVRRQKKEEEKKKQSVKIKNTEKKEEKKQTLVKRFKKPTVEEIGEYIKKMNYSIDSQRFFDYYESVGWKVGKNPMKDWKACCRTWQRKNEERAKSKIKKSDDGYDYGTFLKGLKVVK